MNAEYLWVVIAAYNEAKMIHQVVQAAERDIGTCWWSTTAPLTQRSMPPGTQALWFYGMQAADGVDFVGDITDESFVARMKAQSFRSVLCCNLLEHVEDRVRVARVLTDLVRPEGHLILSVPNVFPYHPDPIDTMYRPDPEELASLFPGMLVTQSAIVGAGTLAGYALRRLFADPAQLAKSLSSRRSAIPATAREGSRNTIRWALRPLKVTCLILRKPQR